jgi:hypothetical protein
MMPSGQLPVPAGTVYFSAADRQTEFFVAPGLLQGEFERSLIHSLLFNDAILIPDIFYFISHGLSAHIKSHIGQATVGLLEAATSAGTAIPSFRNADIGSFNQANDACDAMGIRGLLDDTTRHLVVHRLDTALQKGRDAGNAVVTTWPTHSVGERYGERLQQLLRPDLRPDGQDYPPVRSPELDEVWVRTRRWRTTCLDEALEAGQASGGFRRGDYMATIGRSIGLTGRIDDMAQLLEADLPSADLLALRVLCQWINECYHYNQAREFGLDPNWSRFHPDFSTVTLSAMESIEVDLESRMSPAAETTVQAALPPPRVLARAHGESLVAVRNGTAGGDFFDAVSWWRTHPEDESATKNVQVAFKTYAAQLRKTVYEAERYSSSVLQLRLARLDAPRRGALTAAGAAIGATITASDLTGKSAPLAIVGSAAWASYLWMMDRPRRVSHRIRARRRPSLEVNLM